MLKKAFVLTMFGSPFSWTQNFIDHVQFLGEKGWEWKIFTPHDFQSKGNVEIIKMSADDFNKLVKEKLDLDCNLYITEKGVPSLHVTDFYITSGVLFADYLKGYDFWGITNLDVVYGNLDHYIPDTLLTNIDVFTDDVDIINGVFSLYRNTELVNNLFRQVPFWKDAFTALPCPRCTEGQGNHALFGTDEYGLTQVMRTTKDKVRYAFPSIYPLHSYDRLAQHQPEPQLRKLPDGSLCELFYDVLSESHPNNPLIRKYFGREIMYFHFLTTKQWPKIQSF